MIYILDHRDSFTYNIFAAFKKLGSPVEVHSTQVTSIEELQEKQHLIDAFVLSPGPGHPSEALLFHQVLQTYAGKKPILGICLGHQAIVQHYGGQILSAHQILHGHSVEIHHDRSILYEQMPNPFLAMRYNSLEANLSLPQCLQLSAWTNTSSGGKVVMGVEHTSESVFGVQFHPESVGSPQGSLVLSQFTKIINSFAHR